MHLISPLTYGLYWNMVFNLYIFGDFLDVFMLLISSLIPMWSENIVYVSWFFFSFETCFKPQNIIYFVHTSSHKKCIFYFCQIKRSLITIRSSELIMLLKSSILLKFSVHLQLCFHVMYFKAVFGAEIFGIVMFF